jgi:uncharacterized protein YjiS (DUF1127 family)
MTQYVLAATEWLNFNGIFDWFRSVKTKLDHQSKVRATIKELSQLSDAELRDIGIHRGDIYAIAHESYLDNQDKVEYNRNLKGWV